MAEQQEQPAPAPAPAPESALEPKPEKELVLVLSRGNSVRGQMAAAFLRECQGDKFQVECAGLWAATHVHPLAVRVMKEMGIDLSKQETRDVKEFLEHEPVRHLIIVSHGAIIRCPQVWPGVVSKTILEFRNPVKDTQGQSEAKQLSAFRRCRDAIENAMRQWSPPES